MKWQTEAQAKMERERQLVILWFNQEVETMNETINYTVITFTDDHISHGNHHNYKRSYAGFIFIMVVGFDMEWNY